MVKKDLADNSNHRVEELEKEVSNAHSIIKAVLDSFPYVAWLKDKEGLFIHVNTQYVKAIGYPLEQIIGKTDFDFYPKDLANKYLEDDERVINSRHEIHFQDQHGDEWFSTVKAPVFDEKGNIIGTTGVERNITEKITSHTNLEHERDHLIALMDNIPDTIYFKDMKCRFTRINKAKAREIGEKSASEAIGKTDFDYLKDKEKAQVKFEDDKHLLETGIPIINKIEKNIDHNGREYWISTSKSAIRDKDGNILGLVGISRDITEQTVILQRLTVEREFLQVLMDYIPSTIYFKDRQSKFTKINKAQAETIGIANPDEAIGKTDSDYFPSEHSNVAYEDEQKLMETGIPMIDKVEKIVTASGEIRWVNATKFPVKDEMGNVTGLVGMSVDITERYMYEQKLKDAREKAEQSDRLKTAFLANMSHEIRTPMNGIIGFSNLLRDASLTATEREEFLNHINNCGSTLLTLIDDIIDISKIEAGQITIRMTETSVNTIMHELLASFQTTKINENKSHIEIVNNNTLPDDKVVIYTDPYRFRQIFSNLIGNALKFTNEGTIEFGYKHNDPDNLEFYVKDSGIGIPKDKQNMIFERFGKIIDTKITNKKGTGLGLAIASNLTLLLGGKMRVDSDEGKGSIFYFTLPYKPISGQANIKTPFDFSLVNLKGKTILIAEDEDTSFFYYKELFKDTGVKLLWVKNGNDAIHSFKFNQGISLIIMDCHMPEMDGLTAIREIKKLNKNMVPIIAHTSFAKAEEKEQYLREGSAAYLSKPVLKDELFRLIYKLIC